MGTDQWYLDEIKGDYQNPRYKGYDRVDIGAYNLKVLGIYPEADFEYLGQQLQGAPDERQPGFPVDQESGYIPPRIDYIPHWLDLNSKVASHKTFKLYHWVKNCRHYDIKLHINTTYWLQIIETQELEEESYLVLKPFRKPSEDPELSAEDQDLLEYLIAQDLETGITPTIDSIELRFHQVDNLNQYIADSRPIPPYLGGKQIEEPFLEWYLSKRIEEWVAFGGERLFEKGEYLVQSYKIKRFRRDFYWDLWQDIENLRWEALVITRLTINLQSLWRYYANIQVERERAASFDTQA